MPETNPIAWAIADTLYISAGEQPSYVVLLLNDHVAATAAQLLEAAVARQRQAERLQLADWLETQGYRSTGAPAYATLADKIRQLPPGRISIHPSQ